jgi:diaminopimelate epimerase
MQSPSGIVRAGFTDTGLIRVDMGPANFDPASLPFKADSAQDFHDLIIDDQTVRIGAVSMGNPHAVIEANNVNTAAVGRLGPALQNHPAFPESVNVGFMQIESRERIALRVFERGVGETLACGTGACAAVAMGVRRGSLNTSVTVALPGGELMVNCERMEKAIWLTGPAHFSFEGQIEL